jgi:hypothetical protein
LAATQFVNILFPQSVYENIHRATYVLQYFCLISFGIIAAVFVGFLPPFVENILRLFLWIFLFPFFTFQISKFWLDEFQKVDSFRDVDKGPFSMLIGTIFLRKILECIVGGYLFILVKITLTLWPVSVNEIFPNVYKNIKVMFSIATVISVIYGNTIINLVTNVQGLEQFGSLCLVLKLFLGIILVLQ